MVFIIKVALIRSLNLNLVHRELKWFRINKRMLKGMVKRHGSAFKIKMILMRLFLRMRQE